MLNQWARSKNEVNENEEVGKIFTAENRYTHTVENDFSGCGAQAGTTHPLCE